MKMSNIPFGTTDWNEVERTEHPGETGVAYWRTRQFDNVRVSFQPLRHVGLCRADREKLAFEVRPIDLSAGEQRMVPFQSRSSRPACPP